MLPWSSAYQNRAVKSRIIGVSELMKEVYHLNKSELPTIPVPHDCIIRNISVEGHCIIFVFEEDISYHDSIKCIRPNARTLTVKYHLTDDNAYSLYKQQKTIPGRRIQYKAVDGSDIVSLAKRRLEYLYHYVGYSSIIIKLFSGRAIVLEADVDHIEFEWVEKE